MYLFKFESKAIYPHQCPVPNMSMRLTLSIVSSYNQKLKQV